MIDESEEGSGPVTPLTPYDPDEAPTTPLPSYFDEEMASSMMDAPPSTAFTRTHLANGTTKNPEPPTISEAPLPDSGDSMSGHPEPTDDALPTEDPPPPPPKKAVADPPPRARPRRRGRRRLHPLLLAGLIAAATALVASAWAWWLAR